MNWALANGETLHGISIHVIGSGIDSASSPTGDALKPGAGSPRASQVSRR